MQRITDKIKAVYHTGDVAFYCSLFGPLFMGTVHLISVLIKFDWIVVNYCIFCFLMCLFKVWQWAIEKYKIRPNHYVAGFVSVLIIIAPMMASFLLTILYRNATHYLIDWFIYAYATYGTVKMVFYTPVNACVIDTKHTTTLFTKSERSYHSDAMYFSANIITHFFKKTTAFYLIIII